MASEGGECPVRLADRIALVLILLSRITTKCWLPLVRKVSLLDEHFHASRQPCQLVWAIGIFNRPCLMRCGWPGLERWMVLIDASFRRCFACRLLDLNGISGRERK